MARGVKWTPDEKRALVEHAQLGLFACRRVLPRRSVAAIRQMARKQKIRIRENPAGNTSGNRNGNLRIPAGVHPLVRRLLEECNRQQITVLELTERAGYHRAIIRGMRRCHPRVDVLIAMLNVLGLDLAVIHMREHEAEVAA